MDRHERSHVALYVWDYFFVTDAPSTIDTTPRRTIERATMRIRESEMYLDSPAPPDVRVQQALRVRNAARTALRNIDQLSVKPAQWVVDGLVKLEAHGQQVLDALSPAARELVVH